MELLDVNENVIVAVTREELRLLASSVGEALEAVDEWEFSTRLGAEPEEARALLSVINDLLHQTYQPD